MQLRCVYCKQMCEFYPNVPNDYEEYDVNINDMEMTVYIHNKCLPKILGQWISDKIHPVLYGTPYDCTPRMTCDTVECTKKKTEE